MEKYLICSIICILSVFGVGCQSINYKSYEPPEFTFEEFPKYDSELDKLTQIESPDFLYVKITGNNIEVLPDGNEDAATHVIFEPAEFSKISAVVDRAVTYKEMIQADEDIINKNIDMINRYLSYLKMERELTRQYYFMWKDVRETYMKEKRDHAIDNIINRGTLVLTIIGGVAIAAL